MFSLNKLPEAERMQTQTSPVHAVTLRTGLSASLHLSHNDRIVHKAQKSLAKWEINNVNTNALRWAAALECPNLTVVVPPFLSPKWFFKIMSAPLELFLGRDSGWFGVRISSNSAASLRVLVLQIWTASFYCVLPHLFQTSDKDSPYLGDPLEYNTYKHKTHTVGLDLDIASGRLIPRKDYVSICLLFDELSRACIVHVLIILHHCSLSDCMNMISHSKLSVNHDASNTKTYLETELYSFNTYKPS